MSLLIDDNNDSMGTENIVQISLGDDSLMAKERLINLEDELKGITQEMNKIIYGPDKLSALATNSYKEIKGKIIENMTIINKKVKELVPYKNFYPVYHADFKNANDNLIETKQLISEINIIKGELKKTIADKINNVNDMKKSYLENYSKLIINISTMNTKLQKFNLDTITSKIRVDEMIINLKNLKKKAKSYLFEIKQFNFSGIISSLEMEVEQFTPSINLMNLIKLHLEEIINMKPCMKCANAEKNAIELKCGHTICKLCSAKQKTENFFKKIRCYICYGIPQDISKIIY